MMDRTNLLLLWKGANVYCEFEDIASLFFGFANVYCLGLYLQCKKYQIVTMISIFFAQSLVIMLTLNFTNKFIFDDMGNLLDIES